MVLVFYILKGYYNSNIKITYYNGREKGSLTLQKYLADKKFVIDITILLSKTNIKILKIKKFYLKNLINQEKNEKFYITM